MGGNAVAAGDVFNFILGDGLGNDPLIYDFDQIEDDLIEFQIKGLNFNKLDIDYNGTDTIITSNTFTGESITLVEYDNDANTLTVDDFAFV